MDERTGVKRFGLLDPPDQIPRRSQQTRIFVTGRPHIRVEVEKCFAARVVSLPLVPTKGGIARYHYARPRLAGNEMPDAIGEGLGSEILRWTPENILEI